MATAYWEKRAAFKQAAYDRADAKVLQKVHNTYDRAFEQVDRDIDRIISTFTRKTGLTPKEAMDMLNGKISVADITGDLTPGALEVLERTGGYQARITRLDAIKDSFRTALTQASEAELKAVTNHLEIVGETAYKMTSYDIQKSVGYAVATKGIPSRSLDRILKYKWSGESFSKRVWKNRDAMVSMLDNAMKEMVGIGKLTDATYQDIKGLVDITKWAGKAKSKFKDVNQFAKYAANRLIRTESSYVSNQTTAVAYGEYGIEQYEFLSTLDRRTSSMCQNHDGLINPDTGGPYMMSDIEVGKNYPPLHPFCRSATAPAIEGRSRDKLKRRARRPDGKTELIPRDMNYKEWDQWQQDGAPPDIQKWREGKTKSVGVNSMSNGMSVERVKFTDGTASLNDTYEKLANVYRSPSGIKVRTPIDVNSDAQFIKPEQITRVTNGLPSSLSKYVDSIDLVDYENPQDEYWRARYENFSSSFAVGGNGRITFFKNNSESLDVDLLDTLLHESGHCMDSKVTGRDGVWYSETTPWTRARISDKSLNGLDSVTSYGANSPKEDFAESIREYVQNPVKIDEKFPNRAKLLKELLYGK